MAIKIVMESQHRRLAPQRKTIPTQAPAAAPSVRPVLDPDHPPSDSAATINGDVLSNIAINTPSTSQDQDGYRYDYVRDYEDDDENAASSPADQYFDFRNGVKGATRLRKLKGSSKGYYASTDDYYYSGGTCHK